MDCSSLRGLVVREWNRFPVSGLKLCLTGWNRIKFHESCRHLRRLIEEDFLIGLEAVTTMWHSEFTFPPQIKSRLGSSSKWFSSTQESDTCTVEVWIINHNRVQIHLQGLTDSESWAGSWQMDFPWTKSCTVCLLFTLSHINTPAHTEPLQVQCLSSESSSVVQRRLQHQQPSNGSWLILHS